MDGNVFSTKVAKSILRDPTVLGSFNFDTHLLSVPVTLHVELELLRIFLKQYCDSQVIQVLPTQVYTTDKY